MSAQILSGIYRIRNTVNGKVYVGSAVDVPNRWHEHRKHLRKGDHHSRHLQAAWNKYGEAAFVFEIVEVVERKDLLIAREQWHLDGAFGTAWPYNISPTAGSLWGFRHTEASKSRMSLVQKGKGLGGTASVETRARLSLALKGLVRSAETRKNMSLAQKGHAVSPATRQKISSAHKGKMYSPEYCKNMSLALKGRVFSEEHREKLSLANIGKKNSIAARAKMSLAWKRRAPVSAETRAKMSLAGIRRWKNKRR